VRKLEVPTQLDRAQGDVHAAGNPHIQTDPRNIAHGSARARRACSSRPVACDDYAQRQADFAQRWQQAIARWTAQAAPAARRARWCRSTRPTCTCTTGSGLKEVAVLEPEAGRRADGVAPARACSPR
jgi:zinc/manganese transport system substrate-binding protein